MLVEAAGFALMDSDMRKAMRRNLGTAGAIASLVMLGWGVYTTWTADEGSDRRVEPVAALSGSGTAFETTGNTHVDVQQALILLGEWDGPVINGRSTLVEEAIRRAENKRRLRADGDADKTLLGKLVHDLEARNADRANGDTLPTSTPSAAIARPSLTEVANVFSIVIGAIGSLVFGWMKLRQSR